MTRHHKKLDQQPPLTPEELAAHCSATYIAISTMYKRAAGEPLGTNPHLDNLVNFDWADAQQSALEFMPPGQFTPQELDSYGKAYDLIHCALKADSDIAANVRVLMDAFTEAMDFFASTARNKATVYPEGNPENCSPAEVLAVLAQNGLLHTTTV